MAILPELVQKPKLCTVAVALDVGPQTHMPMVRQKLGAALKGAAVDQGIGGEEAGSPAPYLAMAHLLFESVEAFLASFGPHAEEFADDVPNYTNTQPTIQISEVKLV